MCKEKMRGDLSFANRLLSLQARASSKAENTEMQDISPSKDAGCAWKHLGSRLACVSLRWWSEVTTPVWLEICQEPSHSLAKTRKTREEWHDEQAGSKPSHDIAGRRQSSRCLPEGRQVWSALIGLPGKLSRLRISHRSAKNCQTVDRHTNTPLQTTKYI